MQLTILVTFHYLHLIVDNFTVALLYVYGEDNCHWSGCWTAFPSNDAICNSEFGIKFKGGKDDTCGFLRLGKKACCIEVEDCK